MYVVKYLILLCLCIFLTQCVEPIKFKIKSEEPKLVVYGVINDQDDSCMVKLSYTGSYLSEDGLPINTTTPALANRVSISDNEGNEVDLDYYAPGEYLTRNLKGKVGNTYTLLVEMPDGKKYKSKPETLPNVPNIDEISFQPENRTRFINGVLFADAILHILISFEDNANQKNFYKWKWIGEASFRINSELAPPVSSIPFACYYKLDPYASDPYADELNVLSDKNIDGQKYTHKALTFNSQSFDVRFRSGISLLLAQYSLTQEAFEFWNKMKRLVNNQGSIFDPAPFQVIGNMYSIENEKEIVLGYFGASSVRYIRYQFYVTHFKTIVCSQSSSQEFCVDCRRYSYGYSFIPPFYWQN